MPYLTDADQIRAAILQFATYPMLWVDTEVADWWTSNPKLSLIQVLADPHDRTGNLTYVLDVLHQPDLARLFIEEIMVDARIQKIFHNASYDLNFLGQTKAQNVTCTLKLARSIPKSLLGTSNCKLKTLAQELCGFTDADPEQQSSNWGKRPLSSKQLLYAKMDTVYLAQVYQKLLSLTQPTLFKPVSKPINTDNQPFSVTKVRVAFECARLFYLVHHFGGRTVFLPKGQALGIGNAFHELSDRFVQLALVEPQFQTLFQPEAEQLEIDASAARMQELFYSLVFFPYLQAAMQAEPGRATALHQLWQGLTRLIQRWAELLVSNRRFCTAAELLEKTFLAQELKIQSPFTLPDGSQQLVRGQFDSLVYDFAQQRLCVVEYKTYQTVDQSAQIAQVALYSYMLREKVGVAINSAVYSVLPTWQESTFTWDELDKTVHQLIPHKLQQMRQWLSWQPGQPDPPPPTTQSELCEMCPQQTQCQTFFPLVATSTAAIAPSAPGVPEPVISQPKPELPRPVEQAATTPSADQMGQALVNTLQSFGVGVTYYGAAIGPAFIRVKLKPNPGVKVNSILRLSDDLRVQLGMVNPPLIAPQAGYVSVDLPRSDRQAAYLEDYLQSHPLAISEPTRIAIGIDLEGQLVEADLSDPNTCHFLVGGTTGSGKSEFLRSLLLSLLLRHPPHQVRIALVDPKRVTFPEFEQMPWLYQPVVKTGEQAIALMENLVAEMESRYRKFEMGRCHNLDSYNQKFTEQQPQQLPRIVCIFDEYADLMAEKEMKTALELSIKRLGAMARAAGIHLVIATQRPEAAIVTPIIRSNLPGRVALKTASEADSMMILGGKQTEAAYLLGKGDLLFQSGAHLLRLQSLFAPRIQIPVVEN